MPKSQNRRTRSRGSKRRTGTLIFERRNYVLMAVGILLVAVGFAIMRIDNQFLGTLSLDVAPIILVTGYLGIIYAILWRPSEDEDEAETTS